MTKSKLTSVLAGLVLLISALSLPPSGSYAQTTRTFPETGHTVKGKFLQYWNSHGGLAQQGYPISEEIQEKSDTDGKTYTVQYFERAVFELHPEFAGTDNEVLLSLLGVFFYKAKYPSGAPGQETSTDNARRFDETGYSVGGAFRDYWESHGGLAQQGYPISNDFQERSSVDGQTYWVQYFQRAVFEYHPENAGTPSEVLLSLLGVFQYKNRQGGGNPPAPLPVSALTVPGWTHVVVSTNNIAFFYNVSDGSAVTARVGDDGSLTPLQKYPDPAKGIFGLAPGWANVVACPNNILFLSTYLDGYTENMSMGNDGVLHLIHKQGLGKVWDSVNSDETGNMLFYHVEGVPNGLKGTLTVGKITPEGIYSDAKTYNDFDPSWSSFVPVTERKWLWYSRSGRGDVISLNADGTYTTLQSYKTFGLNWTNIVSDGVHMVFYTSIDGVIVDAGLGSGGEFLSLYTYPNVDKTWTNLAASHNHIFIAYARDTGKIATFMVNEDGIQTVWQRYNP